VVDLSFIGQILFNGLVNGSIYVLVALGLTLMFGVFEVPNFAHGQTYMMAAFFAWMVTTSGMSFYVALLVAILATAALGVAMDRLAFNPVKERTKDSLSLLLVAFALFEIMGSGAQLYWGSAGRGMEFQIRGAFVQYGMILPYNRVVVILTAVLLILALHYLVQRTRYGKALRAISQDKDKALLLGIQYRRMSIITFAIGSGLAGVAGAMIGGVYGLSPFMGLDPILIAFVVVVIGGLGSVIGAIIGGICIGLIESFVVVFYQAEFSTVITFGLLYFFLLYKPMGMFGESDTR